MTRWTADGRYVVDNLKGGTLIRVDPTRPGQLDTLARTSVQPFTLSRDGTVLFGSPGVNGTYGEDQTISYTVALDGSRPPEPMNLRGKGEAGAYGPTLSPDSRWVAYLGSGGVFVEPYPATGEVHRVSGQLAGDVPYWSPRGDEIFFPSNSQMYVVRVHPGSPPRFDAPRQIAAQRFANYGGRPYAVAPDAQRFLIKIPSSERSAPFIRLILVDAPDGGIPR